MAEVGDRPVYNDGDQVYVKVTGNDGVEKSVPAKIKSRNGSIYDVTILEMNALMKNVDETKLSVVPTGVTGAELDRKSLEEENINQRRIE